MVGLCIGIKALELSLQFRDLALRRNCGLGGLVFQTYVWKENSGCESVRSCIGEFSKLVDSLVVGSVAWY